MSQQGILFDAFSAPAPVPHQSLDLPVNVWLCGQQPSQKQRTGRYTPESNVHPAKMLPEIARRIIMTYSRPGDLILDPMAGIGTIGVEGMWLGRRVICREYEQRFVELAQGNIDLARAQGATGEAWAVQGDARDLSDLEVIVDQLVMSPPYGNRMHDTEAYEVRVARMKEQGVKHDRRWNSPEGCAGGVTRQSGMAYSDDPNNIGNLYKWRYGSIDEVVFSPPYPNANTGGGIHKRKQRGQPSERDTRIGGCATTLSDNPNNIDNIKASETYLGEMLKVYQQCYQVLRRGGYMVLVTRDFRRDGALVDLSGDTIRLCQAAGFQYCQRIIALLCGVGIEAGKEITPRASFWQIRYARAMAARGEPVQVVQHEDVLVFRKPGDAVPYVNQLIRR